VVAAKGVTQNQNVIVTNNAGNKLGLTIERSIHLRGMQSTDRESICLNGTRMHLVSLVEAQVSEFHRNRTEPNVHTDHMRIVGFPEQRETGYRWCSELPQRLSRS